ncbi:heparin lyase I family protein [Crocinitomix algicola]|uniref:heparin lyase I family protein n=1 Tax=Crocinitomix algicola TaxID=1740263 RepID=UPI0008729CC3|nr:heparin lyase I family protein [Crocinitomix algicola]
MKKALLFVLVISFFSCNKKEFFKGPNSYKDGFEDYNEIDEIIDGNDKYWSFFQNTLITNDILIDTTITHSGNRSVKFIGGKTENGLSKASINKQNMAFWEGETVVVDFWLYLVGNDPAQWLFIFDLEEQTNIGAGPGMRLALVDGKLLLEHKYSNPNVEQKGDGIPFPRNQWVNVRFETKLSQKKKGFVKVYQDGLLIINQEKWKTLPSDVLYSTQGTQGRYSQIEFGITANPSENDLIMYVDDISVLTIN